MTDRYVGVQAWELARYHSCRRGVAALDRVLPRVDPGRIARTECYNRRQIRGSKSGEWSLHAVGRALDIYPTHPGHLLAIAATAVTLAPVLGITEVIVGDRRWSGGKWRKYRGVYHNTHVHLGLSMAMADSASSDAELERWCALWWLGAIAR